MEIKRDRMIHLGYGKYWRSDHIVGLLPIENGRGPGRRTEVYVAGLEEPVVASKSEDSILSAMAAATGEEIDASKAGTVAAELVEALQSLSPVLRRMLRSEARFDVEFWVRRLRRLAAPGDEEEQEDLFGG